MGKLTWEFDTLNPDDREDIKAHQNAMGMQFALWELYHNVWRHLNKHQNLSDEELAGVQRVFDELTELLLENGVHIDD